MITFVNIVKIKIDIKLIIMTFNEFLFSIQQTVGVLVHHLF